MPAENTISVTNRAKDTLAKRKAEAETKAGYHMSWSAYLLEATR